MDARCQETVDELDPWADDAHVSCDLPGGHDGMHHDPALNIYWQTAEEHRD